MIAFVAVGLAALACRDAASPSGLDVPEVASDRPMAALTPVSTGLIRRYSAEGNTRDVFGSPDGTVRAAAVPFADGKVGRAFSFSRVGWIEAPDTGLPAGSAPFTVEFWAKLADAGGGIPFFYGRGGTGNTNVYIQIGGGGVCIGLWASSGPCVMQDLGDGGWHHLALTFDGSATWVLYVDGRAAATQMNRPHNTTLGFEPLYLGGYGSNNRFAGLVDELSIYDRALTAAEVQRIAAPANAAPAGLLRWYAAEGNARDVFGGPDGVMRIAAVPFAGGKVGRAFSFSRVGWIEAPDTGLPAGSAPFTVEFWAKLADAGGGIPFYYGRDGAGNTNVYVQMSAGGACIGLWASSGPCGFTNLHDGQWHHFALTFDGSATWVLFIDGRAWATQTNRTHNTALGFGPLYLGGHGTNNRFAGLVDEFTIYNRALTTSEVEVLQVRNTPVGDNSQVTPTDPTTGQAVLSVSLTFSSVSAAGGTTVTMIAAPPPMPSGFQLSASAVVYDIKTTATFAGTIEVCLGYSETAYPDESRVRMLHYEAGAWRNVTKSVNTQQNVVCGETTSLSPFAVVAQANRPPIASITTPASILEGADVQLSAVDSSDPDDGDVLSYAWDLDGNGTYGDAADAALDRSGSGAASATASRRYADNNPAGAPFRVGIKVSDAAGASSAAQADVVVANVAPSITGITAPIDPMPLVSGTATATVGVTFTDPGDDAHTTAIDCGNGTSATGGVCTYTAAGVFTLTATVAETDPGSASDTETYRYVVVYDPSAGFVTGGGWIKYDGTHCPTLCAGTAGHADFGFVSKYLRGATSPSGETRFEFHAGTMKFASTSYDWLVVGPGRAQYKGRGTINGSGDYGFLLTAVDGSPDAFRIKILDRPTGVVVFDNQIGADETGSAATPLDRIVGGGSIVIHSK